MPSVFKEREGGERKREREKSFTFNDDSLTLFRGRETYKQKHNFRQALNVSHPRRTYVAYSC